MHTLNAGIHARAVRMGQSQMSQQKPQIGNGTGDVNGVIPGSDRLRILEFEKKS